MSASNEVSRAARVDGSLTCGNSLCNAYPVLALAGGQDHLVNAYTLPPGDTAGQEPSSLTPEYTLVGHSDNVCALDVLDGPGGYIVSGSWDKTARVWRNFECVATLAGHEQAVWAVLALDEDHVLTGELKSDNICKLVVRALGLRLISHIFSSVCRQARSTLFDQQSSQRRGW